MITLEFHNITFSIVALEMDIDLAKWFQHTMPDFTKPLNITG